jgi:hypothetical protein
MELSDGSGAQVEARRTLGERSADQQGRDVRGVGLATWNPLLQELGNDGDQQRERQGWNAAGTTMQGEPREPDAEEKSLEEG